MQSVEFSLFPFLSSMGQTEPCTRMGNGPQCLRPGLPHFEHRHIKYLILVPIAKFVKIGKVRLRPRAVPAAAVPSAFCQSPPVFESRVIFQRILYQVCNFT